MQKKHIGSKDLKNLEKLGRELGGNARSFKAEMKAEWRRLGQDWTKLKTQIVPVKRIAGKSALEVKAASQVLFKTVRKGYGSIKRELTALAKPRSTRAPAGRRAA